MPVKNIQIDITNRPFENIALALSGGGYRATAFHLGVLSYLNTVTFQGQPLLNNLRMLSTISGGTITGVFYAYSLASTSITTFDKFFKELYSFLQKDDLLKESVRIFRYKDKLTFHKGRIDNVITTFAAMYDEYLFKGETFSALYKYSEEHNIDFMFNATDIERSLPFRFQTRGKFGNGKYKVEQIDFDKIKLSDIVAASSCFPGGFEPMFFPNDFLKQPSKPYPTIRLMDGGVIDNQGTGSILLGEKAINALGTILISDVSCELDIGDNIAKPKSKQGFFTSLSSNKLKYMFFGATLVCFIALFKFDSLFFYSLSLFAGTICLLLGAIIQIAQFLIRKPLNDVAKEIPPFYEFYTSLKHLKIGELIDLLSVRLSSVFHLNNIVFLTRMRGMNFNYIMDNPKYYYRSVINSIYELKEDDKKPIIEREQLKPYIDDANNMPTTLWFTKTQKESDRPMLNSLIVAGQATVCYNLIQYITKVKSNKELYALLDDAYKTGLDDFEKDLTANFEAFKNKPEWLLKQFLG